MWKKILRIIAIIIMIIVVVLCFMAVLAYAGISFATWLPASLGFLGELSAAQLLALAAAGGVLSNLVSKEGAAVVTSGVASAVAATASETGTVAGGLIGGVGALVTGALSSNLGLVLLGAVLLLLVVKAKKNEPASAPKTHGDSEGEQKGSSHAY